MTNAKTRSPKRPMIFDELQGHIRDVLNLPISPAQTTAAVLSRVNGAPLNDVLAAALAVAREQASSEIAELKRALAEAEEERDQFMSDFQDLRDGIARVLEEGK